MNKPSRQVSLDQLESAFSGLVVFDENRRVSYVSKALERRGVLPNLFPAQYVRSVGYHKSEQKDLESLNEDSYPLFFKAKDATFPHVLGRLMEWDDGESVLLGQLIEDEHLRSLLPFACDRPGRPELDLYISHIIPTLGDLIKLTNRFIEQDQHTRILNRELDALVSHLPGGILLEDSEGVIHKANPSLVNVFGFDYAPSLLLGHKVDTVVRLAMRTVKSPKSFLDHIEWARLTDQDLYKIETELRDGRVLQWDSILIYQGGSAAARLWYFQDVSDWRAQQSELEVALKDARKANEDREAFLSLLGREYRDPLNVIQGVNQFLRDMPLSRSQRDYVQIIDNASKSMVAILNDLDAFNQLREGTIELNVVPVDLEQLFENLMVSNFAVGSEDGLEYILHMDEQLPNLVMADPDRLTQVMHHLMQEVKRYAKRGQVLMKVSCLMKTETMARIVFEVSHSDVVMSHERAEAVLECLDKDLSPFDSRNVGQGLGLSICKRLVSLMSGVIRFRMEEGEGTRFFAELDMKPVKRHRRSHAKPLTEGDLVGFVTASPEQGEALKSALFCLGCEVQVITAEAVIQGGLYERMPGALILDEESALKLRNAIGPTHSWYGAFRAVSKLLVCHNPNVVEDAWVDELNIQQSLLMPVTPKRLRDRVLRVLRSQEEQDPQTELNLMVEKEASSAWQYKVLVVEDQYTNQLVLKTLLEGLSCKVDIADSGEETLRLLENGVYDIIFMDIYLTGIDGVEATRRLREMEGGGRCPPVVAMTADVSEEQRKACFDVGMNEFLSKPVSKEKLQLTLDKWCNYFSESQERDVDMEGLEILTGGDLGLLGQMVDVFEADAPKMMQQMRGAIREQSGVHLMDALKLMRSNLAFLHATRATKLLLRLEKAVQIGDWHTSEMAYMALEKAIYNLSIKLQERLAS